MRYLRIVMVVVVCAIGALAMGHVGCGGGAIPFGGQIPIGDSDKPAVNTTGKPVSSEPVLTPLEIPVPVVTLVEDKVPPPEEGVPTVPVPCLMNYADHLQPLMLLALKNTPNVLALQQFFDTFTKDRILVGMDDLVGMVPSLATEMIVGKAKDIFVLLRYDPATSDAVSAEELTKLVVERLNADFAATLEKQQSAAVDAVNIAPTTPRLFSYAQIVNDPGLAFVVTREPLLTEVQNLKVKPDCRVCTVGSCNEKKPSDVMIIVRGSLLKNFSDTLIAPDDMCKAQATDAAPSDAVKAYDNSFAISRMVIGIDAVEGKTMSLYLALFSGEECSQASLVVSASVYFNIANPFGKALLTRIVCNTVGTATRMPAAPVGQVMQVEQPAADASQGDATVQPAAAGTDVAPTRDLPQKELGAMDTRPADTGASTTDVQAGSLQVKAKEPDLYPKDVVSKDAVSTGTAAVKSDASIITAQPKTLQQTVPNTMLQKTLQQNMIQAPMKAAPAQNMMIQKTPAQMAPLQ